MNASYISFEEEFDRQVMHLRNLGYPQLSNLTEDAFVELFIPLKKQLSKIPLKESADGYIPFVIVIKSELVTTEVAFSIVDFHGKSGFVNMTPVIPGDFEPIETVTIPSSAAYLLVDIDRGASTLNIAPNKALEMIVANNRSPLTIDEGVAILTHFPDFLKKNNCFSLLGSRKDDKKVPAIWISGDRPRLGWCWEGNPHTWLGSASCGGRIGI